MQVFQKIHYYTQTHESAKKVHDTRSLYTTPDISHFFTMNAQNWAEQDIDRGMVYLEDHEQEATDAPILTAGDDIKILLPTGLPAFGANVVGMFMMAPLILFMMILTVFPLQLLWSGTTLTQNLIFLILLSVALFGGLVIVLRLMLRNRELFPRSYFVTLGERGIAMHFSRLHFPFNRPRLSIPWEDIQVVKKNTTVFMPILFLGILRATTIEVISSSGEKIIIPFRLPAEKALTRAEEIKQLIGQKTRR